MRTVSASLVVTVTPAEILTVEIRLWAAAMRRLPCTPSPIRAALNGPLFTPLPNELSLNFDVGGFGDFGPALQLALDKRTEFGRCVSQRIGSQRRKSVANVGQLNNADD